MVFMVLDAISLVLSLQFVSASVLWSPTLESHQSSWPISFIYSSLCMNGNIKANIPWNFNESIQMSSPCEKYLLVSFLTTLVAHRCQCVAIRKFLREDRSTMKIFKTETAISHFQESSIIKNSFAFLSIMIAASASTIIVQQKNFQ